MITSRPTPQRSSRPTAPDHVQHGSGDLGHAEDAPEPGEPPTSAAPGQPADESLPADAADESREKWWESEADADHA